MKTLNLEPGITYIASVAPSFPAYFNCHPFQLVTALKQAGFAFIEETVEVLPEILSMREKLLVSQGEPIIGESCPKVIQMIQSDFPHLSRYIHSIPSPMELHGKKLKIKYGTACRTVFFSPCIYKKQENEIKQAMDEVHTFVELDDFLHKKLEKPLDQLERTDFDSCHINKGARLGVLAMTVDGEEACIKYLKLFPNADSPDYSEILYCQGGCAQTACSQSKDGVSAAERIINVWEEKE